MHDIDKKSSKMLKLFAKIHATNIWKDGRDKMPKLYISISRPALMNFAC